ncbi:MAG: TonB-dependent receptor [Woeseiaceae bacterium]|nr:TonB-dependent receptor [Woeseiaceae bacterium]
MSNTHIAGRLRSAVLVSAVTALCAPAMAQDDPGGGAEIEEIITTGTRIRNENIIAASPVTTIGEEEIALKQTPNIERVFRDLPITIPGDGENVNNGTAGQATLDLRGLGPQRSLILIDGKRLAPYDINGIVTTDVIPINMLQRVDVVTGGASAVYGSDAMSGAVNFVLRDDFEGFEIDVGYSATDSSQSVGGGGESTNYVGALFGAKFSDDRGHMMFGATYTDRGSILLADRKFGQFGVATSTGSGLGSPPPEPDAACSGNTSFTTAHSSGVGSTTAIPATLNLRSGNSYQFRDNGDLIQGECARFNFNPFNYYQTPQERWQASTVVSYDFNDHVEFYARGTFSSNESAFQIAPSGTFGTAFTIPIMNPFFNDAARQTIIGDLNTGAASFVTQTQTAITDCQANLGGTCDQETLDALTAALAADPMGFNSVGIQDVNGDGVFDENDAFTSTARRRTLELGPRTGIFDTDYYQYVLGVRGSLPGVMEGWNYDVSYQRGQSDFVETRDGFTNINNLQAGIDTVDPDSCVSVTGVVTGAPCTPINIFGPVGSITPAQRDSGFFIAIASDIRRSTQEIYHASIDGTIDQLALPSAAEGLSVAFGYEHSELTASSSPDECLKEAPTSCQGGAGGNRLPIAGAYDADEWFAEAILPLVQGKSGFENLSLEAGFRWADYSVQGSTESWKYGLSWEIVPGFRIRAMEQQAVRVANVGELFSPITTGLDNATFDPCSVGNPNPPQPGERLFDLCVQTGMLPTQVGQVPDIISGQINVFNGTNPAFLPAPEEATTRTFGFVWEPDFGFTTGTTISLDYYDIEINDYINQPTGQEALDTCYVLEDPACLSGVVRIGGAITETGTGIPAYFTNFERFQAEGLDLVVNTGFDLGRGGELTVGLTAHQYLTNEFQTTSLSAVVDCKGVYGTSCDPVPEFRSVLRTQWYRGDFDASLLWRHIGGMDIQANEAAAAFPAFRSVSSQDYFDLTFGYSWQDTIRISLLVANVLDEDPPILGNETGSTAFNSGNTFPSLFDTMGRTYSINAKLSFQ